MLCRCYASPYICITNFNTMKTIQRATTKIVLDTRNKRADETLPIKLRVTFERISRVYGIRLKLDDLSEIDSLTDEDLTTVQGKQKPKEADRVTEIREKLNIIQAEARDIIKKLDIFTFDAFRDQFTGAKKATDPGNVFYKYVERIAALEANNQLGTASSYDLSAKSLKAFIKSITGTEPERLNFTDVTVSWLRKYEAYMLSDKPYLNSDGTVKKNKDGKDKIKPGLTETTVGFYLRPLRAIFKAALDINEIEPGNYPFGSEENKKYVIPTGDNIKKALPKEELKKLFNAKAVTPDQDKAREFWFFSYQCNGMNIKDICQLRNENMEDEHFSFYRAKTRKTKKKPKLVKVMLTDYTKGIIEKYRNPDRNPREYLFPFLSLTDSEITKRKKVNALTSYINRHIKNLAVSVGLSNDISTYFARHSFATMAIQGGASIEFVSKALSHSDTKTTENYFAGFQDDTHRNILESLMNFND